MAFWIVRVFGFVALRFGDSQLLPRNPGRSSAAMHELGARAITVLCCSIGDLDV